MSDIHDKHEQKFQALLRQLHLLMREIETAESSLARDELRPFLAHWATVEHQLRQLKFAARAIAKKVYEDVDAVKFSQDEIAAKTRAVWYGGHYE